MASLLGLACPRRPPDDGLGVRIGHDLDDAAGFTMSLPQGQQLFAGAPENVVAAAVAALRAAYAPYAGAHGVVMDATAWLLSAHR